MNHSSKRHVTQEMNQCCVCTSHAAYQRIHFKVYLLITCFNVSINVEPISHFPHKNVKKKEKKKKDDLRLLRFWVVRVVPNILEDSPKLFCGFRLSRHDSLNPCNPKLTWDVEIRGVWRPYHVLVDVAGEDRSLWLWVHVCGCHVVEWIWDQSDTSPVIAKDKNQNSAWNLCTWLFLG